MGYGSPATRSYERRRPPRLHAFVPVSTLPVGQLRIRRPKRVRIGFPPLEADDNRPPLSVWYAASAADVDEFEKHMRRKVHYVIDPPCLWSHITELARNDYNLNISRYVSTATSEEVIDLKAVHTELVRIEQQAADAAARHNAFLAELGLAPI